jgi:hypothetical protein
MTETTESFRPALYYPYIHIRSEDWLKATLLCVPVVKRLIPENYDPEDTGNIAPYAKNLLRRSASTIDKNTDEATYNRELEAEAEEIVDAWRDAFNETSKDLREAVFESVVLGSEVVKTLVKGPEVYELIAVRGIGLWRVGDKVKRYVERRQKSNHFLSQISNAESKVLRLQFPLGL